MGWTYKHRKLRDTLRAEYTKETGCTDYKSPAFAEWVDRALAQEG